MESCLDMPVMLFTAYIFLIKSHQYYRGNYIPLELLLKENSNRLKGYFIIRRIRPHTGLLSPITDWELDTHH